MPFRFDRVAYDDALRDLASALAPLTVSAAYHDERTATPVKVHGTSTPVLLWPHQFPRGSRQGCQQRIGRHPGQWRDVLLIECRSPHIT